jgi:hypothetical protein
MMNFTRQEEDDSLSISRPSGARLVLITTMLAIIITMGGVAGTDEESDRRLGPKDPIPPKPDADSLPGKINFQISKRCDYEEKCWEYKPPLEWKHTTSVTPLWDYDIKSVTTLNPYGDCKEEVYSTEGRPTEGTLTGSKMKVSISGMTITEICTSCSNGDKAEMWDLKLECFRRAATDVSPYA